MSDGTSNNAFFLTLGAAAKQVGISKSVLCRAIKAGKLSAQRSAESNSFRIDPAELQRYAESVAVIRSTEGNVPEAHPTTPDSALELIEERAARQLAEARLADLKALVEELRQDRDRWHAQAERLSLPATRSHRRWWWRAG